MTVPSRARFPLLGKRLTKRIQTAQNICIRFCLNLNNRTHIGIKEFKNINWLPTKERFKQCTTAKVFMYYENSAPPPGSVPLGGGMRSGHAHLTFLRSKYLKLQLKGKEALDPYFSSPPPPHFIIREADSATTDQCLQPTIESRMTRISKNKLNQPSRKKKIGKIVSHISVQKFGSILKVKKGGQWRARDELAGGSRGQHDAPYFAIFKICFKI